VGESLPLGFGVTSFMVFDIVCFQGTNLCDNPLATREKVILEVVSSKFFGLEQKWRRGAMPLQQHDVVYFPILINRKKLFPLSELAQLTRFLQVDPVTGHRLYVEKEGSKLKRYHLSDGLILTHVGAYMSGSDGHVSFKWKYAELVSIDFVLAKNGRQFEFYLAGDHQDLLRVRAGERIIENEDDLKGALIQGCCASPKDPLAVLGRPHEPVVVELGFNRASGLWVFHCVRSKRLPNHVTVGFQTMEQMVEIAIELPELVQLFQRMR
jgi:hypothetical protein